MALTAEQHSEIATAYETAAADNFVPPEQRAAFARKAELFRLLAKLATKQNAPVPFGQAVHSNTGTDAPQVSVGGVRLARSRPGAQTEPETPAHVLALMHLALRWRLFQLETKTFGRQEILRQRPVRLTQPKH